MFAQQLRHDEEFAAEVAHEAFLGSVLCHVDLQLNLRGAKSVMNTFLVPSAPTFRISHFRSAHSDPTKPTHSLIRVRAQA